MVPAALDLLARAVVLVALAWIATAVLRRRSASLKAMIWTLALGGTLALPALALLTPGLSVPIWRANAPTHRANAFVPPQTSARPAVAEVAAAVGSVVIPSPTAAPGEPVAAIEPAFSWPTATVLLLAWALGSLIVLTRLGASHRRLARMAGECSEHRPDARVIEALVADARAGLGIRRAVALRVSDALSVPVVTGILRPSLVLPADALGWQPEVLRAVVCHELAHVARRDALWQLVSQAACAAYWFVPPVWAGARRAEVLREQAADDVVLRSGVRASSYADTLLEVARLAGGFAPGPAALAMAHPHRMRARIIAILDPRPRRNGLRASSAIGLGVAAAGVVTVVSAIQPAVRAVEGDVVMTVVAPPPAAPAPVEIPKRSVAPARAAAPAAAPQLPSARLCGTGLNQTSSSTNVNGRTRTWTVRMSGNGCKVELRAEGRFEFNDDFTDIASLSPAGTFRVDVTEDGVRRELELRERNGALERTWRIDGRERPFDAEARAWLAALLVELDRRTAIGVDHRLPILLRDGGVNAVLAETALMSGDYARSRYYLKLLEATTLTAADLSRVVTQATSLVKSDHYAAELVTHLGKQSAVTADVRAALQALIERMNSDHYKAQSIQVVVGRGRPAADDMDFLVRTLAGVKSDHYKSQVLKTILRGSLEPAHRSVLAQVARTIRSDHYAAEFLVALAGLSVLDSDAGREAFFQGLESIGSDHYVLEVLNAVVQHRPLSRTDLPFYLRAFATLGSDHYRGEALARLLASRDLTDDDLVRIVAETGTIKGDHYKSEALRRVARHPAATERVHRAVLDAADGLSNHYYGVVSRAVRRF